MRVDLFDFDLPADRIALRPASPRDASRLLVVGPDGAISHRSMRDLPHLLQPGDRMALNDTKVVTARLRGWRLARPTGPGADVRVELTITKRDAEGLYRALARPGRRLRAGDAVRLGRCLGGTIEARMGNSVLIRFEAGDAAVEAALQADGEMPLPPYIAQRRSADSRDREDYQTTFAKIPGSIAAPTAGLHFTPELFESLAAAGIATEWLTLHVGPGTFLPVETADTGDHRMMAEWATLSEESAERLNRVRAQGRRIVAVGSTALRTLETAADEEGRLHAFRGETSLFVTPGYRFKAVDALVTNFHLPRSTLFMLVCAFAGVETMKHAYSEAIAQGYRFYSYGDACLLLRPAA